MKLFIFTPLSFLVLRANGAIYKFYETDNCTGQAWERNVYVGTCAQPVGAGFNSMQLVSYGDCQPPVVFDHGWCAGMHQTGFWRDDASCITNFGFTAYAIMCNI